VRGQLVSYSADAIVDEVKRLTAAGYHEAVLTAVHIGRYENDGLNLAGLVDRILQETPLARLRFSSLEPNELDARLLELVTTHPRVCRHLHLPLQSGSNRILQLMRRPYTREDYLAVVERIKQANADVTIGCDLIVGFPGETDAEFRQSLALLDSGFVDYSHVFSYSDRPGTAATALPGKVRIEEIKERNRRAREISERNRARQMTSQTGKVLGVISEKTPGHDGIHRGVSDNYLKVHLACGTGGGKEIIRFRVTSLVAHHLEGDIITND
jgi:threonylcarbamoyladenosine tRNA methylthiotransferase MtaB